ncbi:uncharacterized protein LOC124405170 [Diprion similis]|uniref:uncharacterized protein LOC124405170 n=1 Tax=Diprion similis TaxID=362088 RepID=UPI001EF91013|nr:uncharacterized protein LOC124405170 [Diprion similis]
MEVAGENPDLVINLLRRHRELENDNDLNRETMIKIEQNVKLKELQSLHDKQLQIKENINKNLKSIVMQKHGLQKVIDGSKDNAPKLPVTYKSKQEAINLVSNAINFVNKFSEVQKSIEPENEVDVNQLCKKINTYGESVNQELSRCKILVDQVGTFRENTEIIKNHCFLPCDEDPGL